MNRKREGCKEDEKRVMKTRRRGRRRRKRKKRRIERGIRGRRINIKKRVKTKKKKRET